MRNEEKWCCGAVLSISMFRPEIAYPPPLWVAVGARVLPVDGSIVDEWVYVGGPYVRVEPCVIDCERVR